MQAGPSLLIMGRVSRLESALFPGGLALRYFFRNRSLWIGTEYVPFKSKIWVLIWIMICLEAPSMELQERFALGAEKGNALKKSSSRRMLRKLLLDQSREEAILATWCLANWWLKALARGRCPLWQSWRCKAPTLPTWSNILSDVGKHIFNQRVRIVVCLLDKGGATPVSTLVWDSIVCCLCIVSELCSIPFLFLSDTYVWYRIIRV